LIKQFLFASLGASFLLRIFSLRTQVPAPLKAKEAAE
jgi:hypothetical protein